MTQGGQKILPLRDILTAGSEECYWQALEDQPGKLQRKPTIFYTVVGSQLFSEHYFQNFFRTF